jgi:hypothetical protein
MRNGLDAAVRGLRHGAYRDRITGIGRAAAG